MEGKTWECTACTVQPDHWITYVQLYINNFALLDCLINNMRHNPTTTYLLHEQMKSYKDLTDHLTRWKWMESRWQYASAYAHSPLLHMLPRKVSYLRVLFGECWVCCQRYKKKKSSVELPKGVLSRVGEFGGYPVVCMAEAEKEARQLREFTHGGVPSKF